MLRGFHGSPRNMKIECWNPPHECSTRPRQLLLKCSKTWQRISHWSRTARMSLAMNRLVGFYCVLAYSQALGNQVGSELLTFDLFPNVPPVYLFWCKITTLRVVIRRFRSPLSFLWGKNGRNAINKDKATRGQLGNPRLGDEVSSTSLKRCYRSTM